MTDPTKAPPPRSNEPYLVWKEDDTSPSGNEPHQQSINKDGVLYYAGNGALAALLLIALPPLPIAVSPVWFLAVATGYAAAVLIAVLMLLPLRRLAGWTGGRLSVARHKKLAELALAFTVAHTLLFLVSDSVALEYILAAQPRFMAAGNLGLVVLALLVMTSSERLRVALFGPRFRFRTVHVASSILLVLLTTLHLIGSALYVEGVLKAALIAGLAAALVLATLRRPKDRPQEPDTAGTPDRPAETAP